MAKENKYSESSFRTKGGKKCAALLKKYATHHELLKLRNGYIGKDPVRTSFWADYYVGLLFEDGRWTTARFSSISAVLEPAILQRMDSEYVLQQVLKAAVHLGLCTESEYDAFFAEVARRRKEEWDRSEIETMHASAKKHGYKVQKE